MHAWHFVSAPGVDRDFQQCMTNAGEGERSGSAGIQCNPKRLSEKQFLTAVHVGFSLGPGVVPSLFAKPTTQNGTGTLEPWDPGATV